MKGYTYATAPLIASDLTFSQQLLEAAGCGKDNVKQLQGVDRLRAGCPTHSAFHFYTTGCPTDPDSAVQGFVDKVTTAKALNTQYALAGTIVNELGSLRNGGEQCTDDQIAAAMGKMFDHVMSAELNGV